ncbi:DUF2442 domain-containing protein [Gloeocapsa sp. PCC 73106]|uniref:DUF2442 domain-containing protein n=1 Tax=Gloeocapsa sp. PCC 73106 TaxID=102232 RepID=UPI0002ACF5B4|nr:DUF2442 domain-containing protein [Gloeocapsa sp. PCC 73106]ELR96621.1 Protein of unknown function (DUF3532) [Gloeocapsa sp. PCC 73106]
MEKLTQEMIDAQIDKVISNTEDINLKEPRADNVSFDKDDLRIFINFNNGSSFSFLASQVEELAVLSPEVLASVVLTSCGKGLRWETPDIDLSIYGLLLGHFGSKVWMTELGRMGGKAKTLRKITAAHENGKKGGRPSKNKTFT